MKIKTKSMKSITITVSKLLNSLFSNFEWDCGERIPRTALMSYNRVEWTLFKEFLASYLTDGDSVESDSELLSISKLSIEVEVANLLALDVDFDNDTFEIVIE